MNTILQKRIDEAAKGYSFNIPSKIYQSCKTQEEMKQWKDEIEQAYIEGGKKSLQNQWISVEEALPEVNEFVFGCVNDEGTPQAVGMAYYDEYGGWHYSDEEEISLITHWMPIPSLDYKHET